MGEQRGNSRVQERDKPEEICTKEWKTEKEGMSVPLHQLDVGMSQPQLEAGSFRKRDQGP